MNRFIIYLVLAFISICVTSCTDNEINEDSEPTIPQDQFYSLETENTNWDGGIYNNGNYLTYTESEENEEFVFYLNREDGGESRGLVIAYNNEGQLIRLGTPYCMSEIIFTQDSTIILTPNNGDMRSSTVVTWRKISKPASSQTKEYTTSRSKQIFKSIEEFISSNELAQSLPIISEIADVYNLAQYTEEGKWDLLLLQDIEKLIKALLHCHNLDKLDLFIDFSISGYEGLINKIKSDLYGDATVKIEEMHRGADDTYYFTVRVVDADRIPDAYINVFDSNGKKEGYENTVYCGIAATRNSRVPEYNGISQEHQVVDVKKQQPDGKDVIIKFKLKLPYDKAKEEWVRPYLVSNLIMRSGGHKQAIYFPLIKYGPKKPLINQQVLLRINSQKTYCESIVDGYDNSRHKEVVKYLNLSATCLNYDAPGFPQIIDWGLVIYSGDKIIKEYSASEKNEITDSKDKGFALINEYIRFDSNDYDIDYNNFHADLKEDKKCTIGSWAIIYDEDRKTYDKVYSSWTDYIDCSYDQKPKMDVSNLKYAKGNGWSEWFEIDGVNYNYAISHTYDYIFEGALFIDYITYTRIGDWTDEFVDYHAKRYMGEEAPKIFYFKDEEDYSVITIATNKEYMKSAKGKVHKRYIPVLHLMNNGTVNSEHCFEYELFYKNDEYGNRVLGGYHAFIRPV